MSDYAFPRCLLTATLFFLSSICAFAADLGHIPGTITADDRQWWSFQPLKTDAPPSDATGWARNDIDCFIISKLKQQGLSPSREASPQTLIRRLSFDLIGLPPTPQEMNDYLKASNISPDKAYEELVDRLLASPRYGERWARHWLDLVRYADSDGYRIDDYRPNAWRYRDYVIRSFNEDKPYDRFVKEQLAGDELYPDQPEALVATGYLRHWIYEYNNRDVRGQWSTILNDITDTTADVFMGLGLQCARCHDHKFDPLLQKDYYRLQAFFANLMPCDDTVVATAAGKEKYVQQLRIWEEKTAAIRQEIAVIEAPYRQKVIEVAVKKFPAEIQEMIRKPAAERQPLEHQLAELAYRQADYEVERLEKVLKGADKEQVLALRKQLAGFDALKPPPLPAANTVVDVGLVAPIVTITKKSEAIEPGYPTILQAEPARIAIVPTAPRSTGRRSALAVWLTDPKNPLTARVMVNRLWQQHFGRGLAANASDFGRLGEQPTHPELLDWLASKFITEGWSQKKLHRLIVCSATYRQRAETSADKRTDEAATIDPENRLLWRGHVRRLDAEQIRDAMLAATGELNLQAGGPAVAGTEPRRTIYTKVLRNVRDPLLDVFDTPFGFASTASRDTTTTPVQSLLLINSPTVIQRSKAMRDRLMVDEPSNEVRRIERAYQLAFGRAPLPEEYERAQAFFKLQASRIDPTKTASAAAAFIGGKIPYRDGQAADMRLEAGCFQIPHDEKLANGDFTIEAFVYPRSVAESAAVRLVAAKWSGNIKEAGWAFGITGKQSRRKPQTVVMQLFGKNSEGAIVEEAIFSDLHVQLNKPYYLAAAVRFGDKEAGQVTFYQKDLSNDDEPLLIANVALKTKEAIRNQAPLTLGGRGLKSASFDGLLDDVRLSDSALGVDQLLFTHEGINKHTVGYWQFENKPNVFRDSSGHGFDIRPEEPSITLIKRDLHRAAWADFCHVLLNASEFLYVE